MITLEYIALSVSKGLLNNGVLANFIFISLVLFHLLESDRSWC